MCYVRVLVPPGHSWVANPHDEQRKGVGAGDEHAVEPVMVNWHCNQTNFIWREFRKNKSASSKHAPVALGIHQYASVAGAVYEEVSPVVPNWFALRTVRPYEYAVLPEVIRLERLSTKGALKTEAQNLDFLLPCSSAFHCLYSVDGGESPAEDNAWLNMFPIFRCATISRRTLRHWLTLTKFLTFIFEIEAQTATGPLGQLAPHSTDPQSTDPTFLKYTLAIAVLISIHELCEC